MQIAIAPFWRGAVRVLRTDAIFVPLAIAYSLLLLRSWQPDTLSLILPGSFEQGFAGAHLINPSMRRFVLLQSCFIWHLMR